MYSCDTKLAYDVGYTNIEEYLVAARYIFSFIFGISVVKIFVLLYLDLLVAVHGCYEMRIGSYVRIYRRSQSFSSGAGDVRVRIVLLGLRDSTMMISSLGLAMLNNCI